VPGVRRRLPWLASLGLMIALAVLALPFLPWPSFVVASGSMTPTLPVGSVVVTQPVDAGEVQVGDIVVFHDPTGRDRRIVHRVVDTTADGYLTRGDANAVGDPWVITDAHVIGEVRAVTPAAVGRAVLAMQTPFGYLATLSAPAVLFAVARLLISTATAAATTAFSSARARFAGTLRPSVTDAMRASTNGVTAGPR
jgi:signal peptidase I